MRLTLDWDTEEAKQANYNDVRARAGASGDHELRVSSSGEGYHYVESGAVSGSRMPAWEEAIDLRQEYGGDEKRINMDITRQERGSPFIQVLYRVKYMDRWGYQPDTGNIVEGGSVNVPEEKRVKENGRIDYNKVAELLHGDVYGSYRQMADSLGTGKSTVGGWVRGEANPSQQYRGKLRRRARHYGIAHYMGDKAVDDENVNYIDEDTPRRRTFVEYLSVPWSDNSGDIKNNLDEDEESIERVLNVHTGSFNNNHSPQQLKHIHDDVVDHVLGVLSPDNPDNNLPSLDLDRENNMAVTREEDSVNYEDEVLDADEKEFYLGNMARVEPIVEPEMLEPNPLVEVVLWDDTMTSIEWIVLGVWDGQSVSDMSIIKDNRSWW